MIIFSFFYLFFFKFIVFIVIFMSTEKFFYDRMLKSVF